MTDSEGKAHNIVLLSKKVYTKATTHNTGSWRSLVTTGQKLRKVPSRSFFHGMDEALSAIKVLQHGLTPPLSPHTPSPRVWAGDWALVRKVSDGVEDEGLGPWGIK